VRAFAHVALLFGVRLDGVEKEVLACWVNSR